MYVFRNYTIENLFDAPTRFSGYDDLSDIPVSDGYIWFYTVPIEFDTERLIEQIEATTDKLKMAVESTPSTVPFYIFTLEKIFYVPTVDANRRINDAIDDFNKNAWRLSTSTANIKVIDFGEFLSSYPSNTWTNWKFYFLSQMIISPTLATAFKQWWNHKLDVLNNRRKKCLVLDLDNTLWSGILGEDGSSGVKMSGDYPGNVFMYFQEALVGLARSGVILTICSKNNESDVLELWEKNPFVKLGPEHIAARRINWQNKADNIVELSKELNIGLDSMVFVDDNPTERELVRSQLPMVAVPEFPKRPYEIMLFFARIVEDYFRVYRLTDEDLVKTRQYKDNARRASEQAKFSDLSGFIKSLDIHIDIMAADEFNVSRIAQMSQKTNQFNLTTRRYSEADIKAFVDRGSKVFCMSVCDRFGDNGITGEIIVDIHDDEAMIDTLLLSCRILGKDIEVAFVKTVLNYLYRAGIRVVTAEYLPTKKNGQVADFYSKIGFDLISEDEKRKEYRMVMDRILDIPPYYKINIE